jgi:hypothetical protein
MKQKLRHIAIISFSFCLFLVLSSCGAYSFSGANIGADIKTFQVNYFQNNAANVQPGIDRDFTLKLQDLLLNQTSLDLVTNTGDLLYEGEIVEFYTAPITATSQSTAAQNRLTVGINVRFYDTKMPDNDFEQRFSFYFDYPGTTQLIGASLDSALDEIFERITQDIFNKSLAKW